MSKSVPCGWCKNDPVHKGKVCCDTHKFVVCSGCKGTDSYINSHSVQTAYDQFKLNLGGDVIIPVMNSTEAFILYQRRRGRNVPTTEPKIR